jgi:hypothetical protein
VKEGKFDPNRHVNYVHHVGAVHSISHIETADTSSHSLITLRIETEYRGRKHEAMLVPVIAWNAALGGPQFVDLLKQAGVTLGDTLHIEGRNTFRFKKNRNYAGVTANRIGIVRSLTGGESFVEWLQEDKAEYAD